MLKKISLIVAISLLSACSSTTNENSFPGEFLGADYILSEADAKQWAIASRQAEQCIYPTLTRIQQQHFAKEDAYIHAQYVLFYPLEKIIGAEYVKMIQEDEKSMGYAQLQFKKFKDQKVKALSPEICEGLRKNARDDLAVVKGQYNSGMTEERKGEEPKNPDGMASSENKFFFDIIKWGAMLLL